MVCKTPTWSSLVTQQLDDRSWVWNYHLCMPLCNSGSCIRIGYHELPTSFSLWGREWSTLLDHRSTQSHKSWQDFLGKADKEKNFEANADPTFRILLPGSGARNPKHSFCCNLGHLRVYEDNLHISYYFYDRMLRGRIREARRCCVRTSNSARPTVGFSGTTIWTTHDPRPVPRGTFCDEHERASNYNTRYGFMVTLSISVIFPHD